MKFRVTGKLGYEVITPSTFILNIHVLRTPAQAVLEESFLIDPYYKTEELVPHLPKAALYAWRSQSRLL
jgi:hypothetical protein